MLTDKQIQDLNDDWEQYMPGRFENLTIDQTETPFAQRQRIKKLEADPEAWFRYYFAQDNAIPAPFHIAATKRVLENPEWYEVRLWSRELAKSTRTMYETLYQTLTGRKKYVMLISSSLDNAARLLMPYKAELELNPRIINDYGKQERIGRWTFCEFSTIPGVSFRAVGTDQPPRGAKTEKNIRPDVLLFDDIDTDSDCRNPEMINKTWKWIDEAAIGTRSVSKNTTIIFCGNRIAVDCCVVRACKYADYVDEVNILDATGNPSWPQKNTIENINRVLKQKSYAASQKEYFNNPITEGSVFKAMAYKALPPLTSYEYLVCYTDPSYKEAVTNDYKATVLVGLTAGEYHIIKCFVDQTSTAKMIDWHYQMMGYIGQHTCYYYMEEVFLQELILGEFYATAKVRGKTIPIMGDQRKKDHKFTRIEALLEPLHRNGKLYLNAAEKDNPYMKKLDEQFTAFAPGSRAHDDGPDAVEGAIWLINQKHTTATAGNITLIKRNHNKQRF
jgi:predicted phage terminase large subunit-like protein